jgi:TPR repeat protein
MSDESQLQLRAKDGDSSLVLSSARSSLVARGRREAAMLTAPVEAESEEHRSEIYYFSDVPLFEKRPIEQLREDAEKGDAKQQSLLAYAYRHGPGGRDLAESARWYRKAADQGNAYAQNTLGLIYDRGEGVAQDYVEAIKWYRKAADKGFEPAYFNLGVKYDNGQGVAQNFTEAVSRMLKKILGEGF